MQYLPINIDLKTKQCLVFGAGTIALRKIQMLLKAQASVICVAKEIHPEINKLSHDQDITIIKSDIYAYIRDHDLRQMVLILSATNDKKLAQHIYDHAQSQNILINTVDSQSLCSYISPAIVNRSPLIISISSSGAAPVLARMIREKIEKLLPQRLGRLTSFAQSLREKVKKHIPSMLMRRKFWENFFESPPNEQQMAASHQQSKPDMIDHYHQQSTPEGEVYLVGAGPGDPELLTIKALRVMQKADVVLHDRLISPEILELVRRDAELINVGKSMGHHLVQQSDTNALLVKHAKKGQRVCRLKGGDPFVFGRGGEEIQALKAANIKYQIVPGITAAVGCSAYAGIPLTHRDYAQNVQFITAHCKNSIDTLDWASYAKEKQTLVVYMGLMKSHHLVKNLIAHGKSPMTAVAIIENGTYTNQRVITGQLQQLKHLIKAHNIKSPGLIVIGEVAKLANELAWFHPQTHMATEEKLLKTA